MDTNIEQERELIIAFILKTDVTTVLTMKGQYNLNPLEQKQYDKIIFMRKQGVPLAYIFGYKDFYKYRFIVNQFTLIPRPETEEIIDMVKDYLKDHADSIKKPNILDIGTGSGCIAITLAKELPQAKIFAVDKSKPALSIAIKNNQTLKTKVKFLQSDLFTDIPNQDFDIIITNLPYVPIDYYNNHYNDLQFEPKSALTDNTNEGKLLYNFLDQCKVHIKNPRLIIMEIDPSQATDLEKYAFDLFPNMAINITKDLSKRQRFLIIKS